MYRDIFTNKWVLGGVGFLIVLSIACVLWYQHDIAPHKKAAADAEKLLRQSQIAKKISDTDSEAEQAADGSVERTTLTTDKPINLTTDGEVENTLSGDTSTNLIEQAQAKDITQEVRVSPHGFGPYPKIPDGYPAGNPFTYDMRPNIELVHRVRIKLFEERGLFADGISINRDTGLIKYVTRNIIWIEWGRARLPGLGEQDYAVSVRGHPDTVARIKANVANRESPLPVEGRQITRADIPPDVTVKSGYEAIDPYQFLNLKRR